MLEEPRRARWPYLAAAATLAYLVCVVFFPIVGSDFIDMDVKQSVIKNRYIQGITAENLKHIFTTRCITSYYPVRSLTYAIDYQLWGLSSSGFKCTNGLIHLVNVYLVFWLVLRLFRRLTPSDEPRGMWGDVSLATFAAGVFGVHPVVVEPVTWVPGREELLMTLGVLVCFHLHMTARRLSEEGAKRRALAFHAGAAFACAVACLSNAVAAVIPLLITAWDLLTLDRPKLPRILRGTSVLWVIGVATIVVKKLEPGGSPLGQFHERYGQFSPERLTLVLNTYWLNVKTLLWPTQLGLSYEWPKPDGFLDGGVILGALLLILTCALLYKLRRRKLTLFGLLWFGLALGPSSQVMPHYMPRADRFLYLPLIGLAVALAMSLRPLASAVKGRAAIVGASAAGVLVLILLDTLSANQVQTWQNGLSVWINSIRVGPNNVIAHRHFAGCLASDEGLDGAASYYQKVLTNDPDNVEALDAAAWLLTAHEDAESREYELASQLAERACQLTYWKDGRLVKCFALAQCNLAQDLVDRGEYRRAIELYDEVLDVYPDDMVGVFNLAWLLATCPDKKLRNPARAVQLAETPCKLTGRPEVLHLSVLAAAYAEAGRFDAAVATVKDAIQQAQAIGDTPLVQQLNRRLELYQDGSAEHNTP